VFSQLVPLVEMDAALSLAAYFALQNGTSAMKVEVEAAAEEYDADTNT
jgi:hypothetical protein